MSLLTCSMRYKVAIHSSACPAFRPLLAACNRIVYAAHAPNSQVFGNAADETAPCNHYRRRPCAPASVAAIIARELATAPAGNRTRHGGLFQTSCSVTSTNLDEGVAALAAQHTSPPMMVWTIRSRCAGKGHGFYARPLGCWAYWTSTCDSTSASQFSQIRIPQVS
jgi:hypothetical protein